MSYEKNNFVEKFVKGPEEKKLKKIGNGGECPHFAKMLIRF